MRLRIGIAAALVGIVVGCTSTTVEYWEKAPDATVDYAYTKPDVDFGVYTRLNAAPFEIYYPEEIGKPNSADVARIRLIFREAFLGAIGDDYAIVDDTGPDVLRVRASLVDLRTNEPVGAVNAGKLAKFVRAGHLTFLMELIDSESGDVLARAADEEKTDDVDTINDWDAVRYAADRWAGLFRGFLDRNLGPS